MHCFEPSLPFIDPNQLNKRANHLKKLYKDVMQGLHEGGIENYLTENGEWRGEMDGDGIPLLRSKNNKRRRLEYFMLSHKIPRWVESFRWEPESLSALSLLGKDKSKKRRDGVESEKKRGRLGEVYFDMMHKIMDAIADQEKAPPLPAYVSMWSVDDVFRWASGTVELSQEDAQVLSRCQVDGRGLIVLAAGGDRRIREIPGLTFQGFLRLVDALVERRPHFLPDEDARTSHQTTTQLNALLGGVAQVSQGMPSVPSVRAVEELERR